MEYLHFQYVRHFPQAASAGDHGSRELLNFAHWNSPWKRASVISASRSCNSLAYSSWIPWCCIFSWSDFERSRYFPVFQHVLMYGMYFSRAITFLEVSFLWSGWEKHPYVLPKRLLMSISIQNPRWLEIAGKFTGRVERVEIWTPHVKTQSRSRSGFIVVVGGLDLNIVRKGSCCFSWSLGCYPIWKRTGQSNGLLLTDSWVPARINLGKWPMLCWVNMVLSYSFLRLRTTNFMRKEKWEIIPESI